MGDVLVSNLSKVWFDQFKTRFVFLEYIKFTGYFNFQKKIQLKDLHILSIEIEFSINA